MTTLFPFKVLFWFENDSKIITEIKRTDIQSEDKSVIYKWIVIQKEKQSENEESIAVLTFQSMESSGENQTRTFEEGILEWNADEALFNEEKMMRTELSDLSVEILELIEGFLSTS